MGEGITPFLIDVPDADLADLRRRLRQTRWPEAEPVADWSQGVPLAYLRDLCGYWADGYDWRGGGGPRGRLRLAGGRGPAERAAAVPDGDRRGADRVRARAVAAGGCAAADPDARLA